MSSSNSCSIQKSGVMFKFLDEGYAFVTDKNLIQLMPLYSRSIASSCPEWLAPKTKFFFDIKFPFPQKTSLFFFSKVVKLQHLKTPSARTKNIVTDYFPETRLMEADDLRELLEIALFTESLIFEKCIYHVIWERTGKGEISGVTKFLYACTLPNAGLIPSTSHDHCDYNSSLEPTCTSFNDSVE